MKLLKILVTIACTAMLSTPLVMAQDHSMHQDQDHRMGTLIRETMVNGYHLSYRLIDMQQKMEEMDMEMSATHHLMVYIKNTDGNPVTNAKVGFLVEGPGKDDQKAMAMGMNKGYGADVDLGAPGQYTIRTKAVDGGEKLMDSFSHKVE